ncbi:MAG: pitrilysin family protein [bacterium]|nr:pitrilysin family protein [bacterium]
MKYLKIALILFFAGSLSAEPFQYPDIAGLTYKPINWTPQKPIRRQLDNGIVVYLLEDHELPFIDAGMYIKAGALYDTKDKVGLADLTAQTLRTGGTKNISPDEINNKLEYDASEIEFNTAGSYIHCSFAALKENFDATLNLLVDILMNPAFQEDKFKAEVISMKENIRRRNDSPVDAGLRNFTKKLRKGHPTGWFPTLETVNNISRKDIIAFHKKYYVPDGAIIAIAGDFNADSIVNELNTAFKEWKKTNVKFPVIPDIAAKYERKVYYVEKNVSQSTIIMGHLGIFKKDPNLYPLEIGNYILGGSMSSWLHRAVRDEAGLAYLINSYFTPGQIYKGNIGAFCQTDGKNTVKAIELVLNQIDKITKTEVDSAEFSKTKDAIKNRFIFKFESPFDIVMNQASLEFFNMPLDFYDKYLGNIDKVTRASMLTSLKQNLFADKMEILVVGNAKDFDKPLSTLGTVEKIKLEE